MSQRSSYRRALCDETEAIALIRRTTTRRCPEVLVSIGDDAALFRNGLVVTTDAYLETVHFDRSYLSLREVGARAVCATLSDIAALGGQPWAVLVALLLPKGFTRPELRELYSGMDAICEQFQTEIAGGDIIAAPGLGLVLTAIGKTRMPRLRSGAKPGDALYLTGYCALAETGRLALSNRLSRGRYRRAIERHSTPLPRIREAQQLAGKIHSLIDTSDGLSTDAYHLAVASRVKIVIDEESLPVHPGTEQLIQELKLDRRKFILGSGEDYELLFTAPAGLRLTGLSVPVTRIGRVEAGSGLWLECAGRRQRLLPAGYDHLRLRSAARRTSS